MYIQVGDNILIHYDASHPEIIEILNTKSNDILPPCAYSAARGGLSKFVYIINFGSDYYKIGITHNPSQRLRTFQSSNPFVSGTHSVIALFVYGDYLTRQRDAKSGLLRPSFFSKSRNPKSYRYTNGRDPGPYALLRQLEQAIHLWCVERGCALDAVQKGNKITTEIFKLNSGQLGELFNAIASWGFATIPRNKLYKFVVPADDAPPNTHSILERKAS